jgi:hypothetical protein
MRVHPYVTLTHALLACMIMLGRAFMQACMQACKHASMQERVHAFMHAGMQDMRCAMCEV